MPGTAGNFGGFWTPTFSDTDTGTYSQRPAVGSGSGRATGASSVWGGAASAFGSVVSGYFGSRAAASRAAAQRDAGQMDVRTRMYQAQSARRNQAEDQRYAEEGVASYRQHYNGRRPLMSPDFTDPTSVEVIDPTAKPKR